MGRRPAPPNVLPRRFYARPALEVARDLLGRDLVRVPPGSVRMRARIVETEAYREDDPASHSYRGRTARTEVMFGPPGRLYVYFTYGMHFCMNVVTGRDGEGSAVLLRAAQPLEGIEAMASHRGTDRLRLLCAGPGRLCQALGVARVENGIDLVAGRDMWIEAGDRVPEDAVEAGPRVGIRSALENAWRFHVAGNPYVSSSRAGMPPRRKRRAR